MESGLYPISASTTDQKEPLRRISGHVIPQLWLEVAFVDNSLGITAELILNRNLKQEKLATQALHFHFRMHFSDNLHVLL